MVDPKIIPLKSAATSTDLSDASFENACEVLCVDYCSVTVMASAERAHSAAGIAARYQSRLLIVPDGFFPSKDQWMLVSDTGAFWSRGA